MTRGAFVKRAFAVKRIGFCLVLTVALCVVNAARSGHEFPVYPSYYPHLIKIATMAPGRAASELVSGRIQAYMGAEPAFSGAIPDVIRPVESLGALIMVRINRNSPIATGRDARCSLARAVVAQIGGRRAGFTYHPYPITPLDGDYLYHADLADAARASLAGAIGSSALNAAQSAQFRVSGPVGRALVSEPQRAQGDRWDVAIDEVDADGLVASTSVPEGASAPPWRRSGWYRSVLLLASSVDDPAREARVRADASRLASGDADDIERINVERDLVATLATGCRALVAGYTVKHEYVNADYSAGIENIGFDSITGLNSPTFIRTAKLKDFPWNGVLSLGVASPPTAAWNPIAGFTDPFGRLMWSAIGDPALVPSPNGAGWMLNRISDVR